MKRISWSGIGVLLLVFFTLAGVRESVAQDVKKSEAPFNIVGDWAGALALPNGAELHVIFHITAGEDGALSSTLDSPDQGAFGIAMDVTTFKEGQLDISSSALNGGFVGKPATEGDFDIFGTWSQNGNTMELGLKRVEPKKDDE